MEGDGNREKWTGGAVAKCWKKKGDGNIERADRAQGTSGGKVLPLS